MLFVMGLGVVIGCRPISTDNMTDMVVPTIRRFSIDSLSHAAYGDTEFSIDAKIDEPTRNIKAFVPVTDVTALSISVTIPKNVTLRDPLGQTYTSQDSNTPIELNLDATNQVSLIVEHGRDSRAYTVHVVSGYIPIFVESDFSYVRNNLGERFVLVEDIVLTEDFEPIAPDTDSSAGNYQGTPFTGIFEGNGKAISNLKISMSRRDYVGFFGMISEGIVRNLVLELASGDASNPSIEGKDRVGALVGENKGRVEHVHVREGYVKGGIVVGGLVGYNNVGTVEGSSVNGTVRGNSFAGGLVGFNQQNSSVSTSYAIGTVIGGNYMGGLIGNNDALVTKSYADVMVSGTSFIGGLVGYNDDDGLISNSYAIGTVTGDGSIGGLVGYNSLGSISRSYATGLVTGTGNVGGLIGANSSDSVTMSYFDAVMTTPVEIAGVHQAVGNDANYQGVAAYYTTNRAVRIANAITAALVTQTQFPSWDFTAIWIMQEGEWPTLRPIQP